MTIRQVDSRLLDAGVQAQYVIDEYGKRFRRRKPEVVVKLRRASKRYSPATSLGRATFFPPAIEVWAGNDPDWWLVSVFHELAHIHVGWGHGHDREWALAFCKIIDKLGYDVGYYVEQEVSDRCGGWKTVERTYRDYTK